MYWQIEAEPETYYIATNTDHQAKLSHKKRIGSSHLGNNDFTYRDEGKNNWITTSLLKLDRRWGGWNLNKTRTDTTDWRPLQKEAMKNLATCTSRKEKAPDRSIKLANLKHNPDMQLQKTIDQQKIETEPSKDSTIHRQ